MLEGMELVHCTLIRANIAYAHGRIHTLVGKIIQSLIKSLYVAVIDYIFKCKMCHTYVHN